MLHLLRSKTVKTKAMNGFSLVEVLIAMLITAIISATAFEILGSAIETKSNTKNSDERLAKLQRTMNRISLDIQQIAKRSVRDPFGDKKPALMGEKSAEESYLSLTRQGKRNPAKLPRSELERVTYKMDDGKLIREQWLALDIVSEDQIVKRELIDNLKVFEVEFYADESWVESWPDSGRGGNIEDVLLNFPEAIKITLEFDDIGEIKQIYYLGDS